MSTSTPGPIQRLQATALGVVTGLLALLGALLPAAPAAASSLVPISGAGSSFSSNAIDSWRRNVVQYGINVQYSPTGSSDGRAQFKNGTADFGVSEIPYGVKDGGNIDPAPANRPFAYMPIVAGGTSFMYNLHIGVTQVTNLRLSGNTVSKIFTGGITTWNDDAIKADNPGLAASLPAKKIVPVVRSDGSGTTAQFTQYLVKRYNSTWCGYLSNAGISSCTQTSNYPVAVAGMTAQSGSTGVAGYVSQITGEGAINYVEYSYAKAANFPVAKILNDAGVYTEPTPSNVAVALQAATLNGDLTQNLDGVYGNNDKRTYPLSSYSYMILPTQTDSSFSSDKGYTLGKFAYYFLCEGQQQAPDLGYSPLPINLVRAGLAQVDHIPGRANESIDITKCNNPTFSSDGSNTLAKNAPQPFACDARGPNQCTDATGGAKVGTAVSANAGGGQGTQAERQVAAAAPGNKLAALPTGVVPPAVSGGAAPGRTSAPGGTSPPGATAPGAGGRAKTSAGGPGGAPAAGAPAAGAPAAAAGTTPGGAAAAPAPATVTRVDPETGQVQTLPAAGVAPDAGGASVPGTDPAGGGAGPQVAQGLLPGAAGGPVAAVPVSLEARSGGGTDTILMGLAGILLVALVVAPPLLGRALARPREPRP